MTAAPLTTNFPIPPEVEGFWAWEKGHFPRPATPLTQELLYSTLSTARHNWVSKYHAASAGASAITFATDFVDQLKGWACWFHSRINCSSFARK